MMWPTDSFSIVLETGASSASASSPSGRATRARSIRPSASLIAAVTPTFTIGFPAKRSAWTSLSAATTTALAFLISAAVSSFSTPTWPCVSTLMVRPLAAAAFSRASLAIKVCAIPVGQPVAATMSYFDSSATALPFHPSARNCSKHNQKSCSMLALSSFDNYVFT